MTSQPNGPTGSDADGPDRGEPGPVSVTGATPAERADLARRWRASASQARRVLARRVTPYLVMLVAIFVGASVAVLRSGEEALVQFALGVLVGYALLLVAVTFTWFRSIRGLRRHALDMHEQCEEIRRVNGVLKQLVVTMTPTARTAELATLLNATEDGIFINIREVDS